MRSDDDSNAGLYEKAAIRLSDEMIYNALTIAAYRLMSAAIEAGPISLTEADHEFLGDLGIGD